MMAHRIIYRDTSCNLGETESVLEGLLRHGFSIPNVCRVGICRACMLQATSGELPEVAQQGLSEPLRQQGMFLSCVCHPQNDLDVRDPGTAADTPATVRALAYLSDTVVRLRLTTEAKFSYTPGQYINLVRADGLARSYSLASLSDDGFLELHIRKIPGGQMSTWAYEYLSPGDQVTIRGPHGDCCYGDQDPSRPLMLVGTGTGLAPLWGIARDALMRGHTGPIHLYHGSIDDRGLYMMDTLRALDRDHSQFHYHPCVRQGSPRDGVQVGVLDDIVTAALAEHARNSHAPAEHTAFVCGSPKMVHAMQRNLFLAGLSSQQIFADAFITANEPAQTP